MAIVILSISFGVHSPSHGQMGGMGGGTGGGMPNTPGGEFGGATDPSAIRTVDGLRIVPSVQISERYDSNVFFASKSQLQGITPEDFISTVSPQVRGLYADRRNLVKVNAVVGAVGSYYANNTGLNYVGANAGAVLDMSDLLSQWRPGVRWMVFDTYFYSPQPPAISSRKAINRAGESARSRFPSTRSKTIPIASIPYRVPFNIPAAPGVIPNLSYGAQVRSVSASRGSYAGHRDPQT